MFHHRGHGEAYRVFKIFPLSRRIINQRDRGESLLYGFEGEFASYGCEFPCFVSDKYAEIEYVCAYSVA